MTSTNPQPSVREAVARVTKLASELEESARHDFPLSEAFYGDETPAADTAADLRAVLALVDPLVEKLRGALEPFVQMAASLKADVSTAHSLRGNGASEWMREDDAEFRRDLSACLDRAREALALPGGGGSARDLAQGPEVSSESTANADALRIQQLEREVAKLRRLLATPTGEA